MGDKVKVDTLDPCLVDTQPAFNALAEYKSGGLPRIVELFLEYKLLATARRLASTAKHLREEVAAARTRRKEASQ